MSTTIDTSAVSAGAAPSRRAAILATLMPGFVGESLPAWLGIALAEGLGGVCVFGANIRSFDQLAALVAEIRAANPRTVIAVDEEGGDVTRLWYDRGAPTPGNAVLGRVDDLTETERQAARIGRELAALGIDLDFAPDADVNDNPLNPVIGVRSFGADAALVARHTAAWVRGLQSQGVAASLKHFPGHGDTALDSHLALPVIDRSLDELRLRELPPFAAGIAAGARTVMTSHIVLPQLDAERPATFSPRILEGLLRGELGFDGVIVSDALDMKGASGEVGIPRAAVLALAGGCDLLCIGTDTTPELLDEIVAAVEAALDSGELPAVRLDEAVERMRALGAEAQALAVRRTPFPEGAELLAGADLALAARAQHREPGLPPAGPVSWVELVTEPSIAVGTVPWGLTAAGAEITLRLTAAPNPAERAELDALLEREATLVLVGRDVHRHDWVRELAAELRPLGALVVDLGWPDIENATGHGVDPDVATFGGSRLVAQALRDLLEGEAP